MPVKLLCIVGARPNFMKLAPVLREMRRNPRFQAVLVHTGQHYDDAMSGKFFRDLGMPEPDHFLGAGSGSHAQQTATIMAKLEPVVIAERPDAVVVAGDVNSTLAGALVAAKLGVKVVHIEAGLRSFDRSMPEEINRIVTDAVTDVYLVTEQSGCRNLLAENVPAARIHLVGNLMIDSLRWHQQEAAQSDILDRLGLRCARYGVLTLHRPANVDQAGALAGILQAVQVIATELPVYFPVHPRTRAMLEGQGIAAGSPIHLIEPLGYIEFLALMASSNVVLTDSGGIQEETTALGIPCLTLRENTERPVTIKHGTNRLAGTRCESILAAWNDLKCGGRDGRLPEFWDGNAASRCIQVLEEVFFAPPVGGAPPA